jgi:hypothetical protein
MSSEEFLTQKKGKGKKKSQTNATPEPVVGMQSQFEVLDHFVLEALEMPPVIQTKPKKISPLIRNAIKSQPEELRFKNEDKIVINTNSEEHLDDVYNAKTDEEDEQEEEENDESENETYDTCSGCYYCNWTGVNIDKENCKRHYYGDVN